MPRRTETTITTQGQSNGTQQYIKLENRLVLLAWLNSLLGYKNNRELLEDCKTVAEGFGSDGRSFLYHHLIARGSQVKITADKLAEYDENIRLHLEKINRARTEKITLRYFQYLAALYTEIVLDRLFNARPQLLADLNAFVAERNLNRHPSEQKDEPFDNGDLNKLAYWMATGSGKTLLFHLNYYQFLHYNREPLDNILLITPYEGLSVQHLEELVASGIPARRFDLNSGGLMTTDRNTIQVIEITKLVEEKRGGGVSVPVEAFEGRNLIFVDEGHKGSGGETWQKYRNALRATGFTFEYSATFGQALSAARNDPLTAEYGKAIVFDYSYKYFYQDGFGKDFRILNLKDETDREQTDLLLLGNLLSFYEQLRFYEDQSDVLRPYNLEKPLWVFVGSTVNAVYTENKQPRSDVLTVVRFLHRVLGQREWAISAIKTILDYRTGLTDGNGQDIFEGRFPLLRTNKLSPENLYHDILARVFHAHGSGGLHLCEIRSSPGELGLRATNAEEYFGLVYIRDTNEFKKLTEENAPEIILEQDAIAHSLFERINRPDSKILILIGAKKFMEGWNSWRVSSMGLLNIGQQEGSQIIQLFGRGVRLKGQGMSLKRSTALPGRHPQYIHLLETLNIFAVRANYMAQFRDYLEREGIELEPIIELPLFTWINQQHLQRGLVVPRTPDHRNFIQEKTLLLEPDPSINIRVDLSVKVEAIQSTNQGVFRVLTQAGSGKRVPSESLAWVDWQSVYLDLLAYKERKGLTNLIILPDAPRRVLENGSFELVADKATFFPRSFEDRSRLQEAVANLLRRYVDKFYQVQRERWEAQIMEYRELDDKDPNLQLIVYKGKPAYMVKVKSTERELIQMIENLIGKKDELYQRENEGLPRIYFDRHIYLPLLLENDRIKITPPGLNQSEMQFVQDLRDFWEQERNSLLQGKDLFLLRNLSRGKGVGFFEERGFYPDFILWVIDGQEQNIVFIEPHGMIYSRPYAYDDKVRLHERLPELAAEIGKRSGQDNIRLDSYIVSATPYPDLKRRYDDGNWDLNRFTQAHILFQERPRLDGEPYDYIEIILRNILLSSDHTLT